MLNRWTDGITFVLAFSTIFGVLFLPLSASSCWADDDSDDAARLAMAQANLAAKQAAAATRSDDQTAEIQMLRSIIADQRKQIAELQAEIIKLKAPLPLTPTAANVHPQSTFTSRAPNTPRPSNWSDSQWKAMLEAAKKLDSDIDAFGAANNLPPEMIAAMHEGRPTPKMPEAALKLFTQCHTESESVDGKVELVWPVDNVMATYTVVISDGYVVELQRPTPISPGSYGSFNSDAFR